MPEAELHLELKSATKTLFFNMAEIKIIALYSLGYSENFSTSVPGWDTILRYKSSLTQVTPSPANFGRPRTKFADASCVD